MKFRKWTMFRSKRSQSALRWCRYLFLVIGLSALGYCGYVLLDAKVYQAYETWKFEQALQSLSASKNSGEKFRSLLPSSASAGIEGAGTESLGMAGRNGSTLGRIEINSIGLAVMIMDGVDGRTLRRAVGHIPGTALPGEQGNIAIAGHRDTFFRPLRNIHMDDEITVTTLKGVYRYRVDSMKLVEPEDTAVLKNSGDAILTLVTCYPFYYVGPAPKRFVVSALRVSDSNEPLAKTTPLPPPARRYLQKSRAPKKRRNQPIRSVPLS